VCARPSSSIPVSLGAISRHRLPSSRTGRRRCSASGQLSANYRLLLASAPAGGSAGRRARSKQARVIGLLQRRIADPADGVRRRCCRAAEQMWRNGPLCTEGQRRQIRAQAETHRASIARGAGEDRGRRDTAQCRPQIQRQSGNDLAACSLGFASAKPRRAAGKNITC